MVRLSFACAAWTFLAWTVVAEDRPSGPVGYLRDQIKIESLGKKISRQLDLWYPTSGQEIPHEYGSQRFRAQKGFAAVKGKVADGVHPLILFSHGFLGMSDQSIFLMEALARKGYVVASMNHADSLVQGNANERFQREAPQFAEFDKWTDAKFRDRHDDIVQLIDELLVRNEDAKSPLYHHLDASRIGGMGHSLGGYTILGLAGAWESWRERRIKSAVLLSPVTHAYNVNGNLARVSIPIQMQGAVLDLACTPALPKTFQLLAGPKELLVLKRDNHFSWTNLATLNIDTRTAISQGNTKLMVDYMIAFFDQTLRGLDRRGFLTADNPDLESHFIDFPKNRGR